MHPTKDELSPMMALDTTSKRASTVFVKLDEALQNSSRDPFQFENNG
jgi:hypothetical protein